MTFKEAISAFARIIALSVLMSLYFFPVGFTGLPESLNSKQILGVVGLVIFAAASIGGKSIKLNRKIFTVFLLSAVFSLWCFFCVVENGASDFAYAKYVMSFLVWTAGAYALVCIIRLADGKVSLDSITAYLTIACVLQCAFVMMVENIPSFQEFVDSRFIQDTTAKELDRFYGIGCSLDSGGIRFCIALLLIAHQIARNNEVNGSRLKMTGYILAFVIITIVGNMVARTTSAGVGLALIYIILTIGYARRATLTSKQLRFWNIFTGIVLASVIWGIWAYNNDPELRRDIRFAFEAFFNYVEKGEFSTSSSDVLLERMWIWPWTSKGWWIGYGLFENGSLPFGYQTDIGYCRFTLYCGVTGMILFSVYFIYNAYVVSKSYDNAGFLAALMLILSFVIWFKVSTDIYQIYAILLCEIALSEKSSKEEVKNRLQ